MLENVRGQVLAQSSTDTHIDVLHIAKREGYKVTNGCKAQSFLQSKHASADAAILQLAESKTIITLTADQLHEGDGVIHI